MKDLNVAKIDELSDLTEIKKSIEIKNLYHSNCSWPIDFLMIREMLKSDSITYLEYAVFHNSFDTDDSDYEDPKSFEDLKEELTNRYSLKEIEAAFKSLHKKLPEFKNKGLKIYNGEIHGEFTEAEKNKYNEINGKLALRFGESSINELA